MPISGLRCVYFSRKKFTEIYDKKDDFTFIIVYVPFLDGEVHLARSYICSDISDFNERNLYIKLTNYEVKNFNTTNSLKHLLNSFINILIWYQNLDALVINL